MHVQWLMIFRRTQQSLMSMVRLSVVYATFQLFFVPAPYSPYDSRVSQNGLNSLLVSWSPPNNRPDRVTGYHISYQEQDGGHRGSVMTGESNLNTTITGLIAGATYSISVAANSSTLPSYPTSATFTLGKCISQNSKQLVSTATSHIQSISFANLAMFYRLQGQPQRCYIQ